MFAAQPWGAGWSARVVRMSARVVGSGIGVRPRVRNAVPPWGVEELPGEPHQEVVAGRRGQPAREV
ncbi:hypothetical protein M444_01270 [Streptomyces sp. Mg1]|nr:hypothetical protein M444_01270 [Streptomyces sp. Mg1]